jgi:hypothetical protein
MEKETTPIEKWIEETSKKNCAGKDFQVEWANGCKILLAYLGLSGIDDPKKWVEEMKDENKLLKRVLKSTDDSLTCISWEGEEPIRLKLEAENEKLKEALGRIYTMDTSFENYINAIVELKQIAGEAIK